MKRIGRVMTLAAALIAADDCTALDATLFGVDIEPAKAGKANAARRS